jgi:hypothetical protein
VLQRIPAESGGLDRIERHYFAESDGVPIDLRAIAERWIRRAS